MIYVFFNILMWSSSIHIFLISWQHTHNLHIQTFKLETSRMNNILWENDILNLHCFFSFNFKLYFNRFKSKDNIIIESSIKPFKFILNINVFILIYIYCNLDYHRYNFFYYFYFFNNNVYEIIQISYQILTI